MEGLGYNWIDSGPPRMRSLGVGTRLSVGCEWPARMARGRSSGSGAQETYLGVETTEMVAMAAFERYWLPGVWWAGRLSPRWEEGRVG